MGHKPKKDNSGRLKKKRAQVKRLGQRGSTKIPPKSTRTAWVGRPITRCAGQGLDLAKHVDPDHPKCTVLREYKNPKFSFQAFSLFFLTLLYSPILFYFLSFHSKGKTQNSSKFISLPRNHRLSPLHA